MGVATVGVVVSVTGDRRYVSCVLSLHNRKINGQNEEKFHIGKRYILQASRFSVANHGYFSSNEDTSQVYTL